MATIHCKPSATRIYQTTVGRAYGRSLMFIAMLIGLALLIDKIHAPKTTTYHYYVYMCAVASGTLWF